MTKDTKIKIKNILELNKDIENQFNNWSISYNKRADMVVFGGTYPEGSFYVNVQDGMMVRVDAENKIHGFAIENAKCFIKKHQEFLPLVSLIYPTRSKILYGFYKILIRPTSNSMVSLKNTISTSKNYLAGQVVYAN